MNQTETPSPDESGGTKTFADEAFFQAFAEERSWEPGWMAELRR
ncbi:uncharacterized protein METZ01_LOCUS322719, partial [marine metagenome]